ncbi:MAG: hypothetical protein D6689_17995 [Deltaproteobacteria bacterium]|nr:MAG: hypothetical protein D6689_17995 [Deltaproteobacteria bacterium]
MQIDGGAVELSWSLRTLDGDAADCDLVGADGRDLPDIDAVRVCWEPVGDAGELSGVCDPVRSDRFRCDSLHGVTGFVVEPGPTAIWIEPVCEGTGRPPPADRYAVPAPIVRTVASGEVATLNALLIAVRPDACESRQLTRITARGAGQMAHSEQAAVPRHENRAARVTAAGGMVDTRSHHLQ